MYYRHMATETKKGLSYFIPEVIEDLRAERGWSYRELGRRSGQDVSNVTRYLQRKRALPISVLEDFCEALGADMLTVGAEAKKRME